MVEDSVLFRADATKSDTAGEVWLLTKSKPIMCWLHTLAQDPMSSILDCEYPIRRRPLRVTLNNRGDTPLY